ncbi:dephospho-CoA kinase [Marinobacterium lutimaris]|uniref:Dephospho-CoA kinase n=1 Tax=Marinobacterium lutimaris TaxID=568106 RepID=A0A1H6CCH5_9GAMM|nr:dephospho-CoA kinase [Marinobacterium lutimaris]SEG70654.1 dephospho-CoA kinase [Marinobacterium lutimaris]
MTGHALKVGLTGGIGSGKSAAANMFAGLGVPVVDADLIAREVVEPGEPALELIAEHFGNDVIQSDGCLDRRALRERVFAEVSERKWLEQLLHPLINQRIRERLAASEAPYVMLVSPLLIESGQVDLVDRVIVVDVDKQTQIERTLTRDKVSAEQVEKILASQCSRVERTRRADHLLDNGGSLKHLREQVESLHRQLIDYVDREPANANASV